MTEPKMQDLGEIATLLQRFADNPSFVFETLQATIQLAIAEQLQAINGHLEGILQALAHTCDHDGIPIPP